MTAASSPALADWAGCRDCGTVQTLPDCDFVRCASCDRVLARRTGRSLEAALGLSLATLVLLIPANLCSFLTTSAVGVSRTSILASSATAMLHDGWPLLALVVFLFVCVFPFLRFGSLILVLASIRVQHRPPWLGRMFRYSQNLATWSMPDVFLLGLAVAYARLAASISVHVGAGAITFILAATGALFVRATLDEQAVWEMISRTPPSEGRMLTCQCCELLLPAEEEARPCPRCRATLHRRLPQAMSRTTALTLAAFLFYFPANLYPLATLPIDLKPVKYTVLEGVLDLAKAKLVGLAALVFCASFAIPCLKLAGIGWCLLSVARRSRARLRLKTKIYRVVEEIGRWSMVDPFVIGCFTPVMHYNALIYGRAEPAAVPFTAVVILTIIGAKTFDPRLMWDAGRRK